MSAAASCAPIPHPQRPAYTCAQRYWAHGSSRPPGECREEAMHEVGLDLRTSSDILAHDSTAAVLTLPLRAMARHIKPGAPPNELASSNVSQERKFELMNCTSCARAPCLCRKRVRSAAAGLHSASLPADANQTQHTVLWVHSAEQRTAGCAVGRCRGLRGRGGPSEPRCRYGDCRKFIICAGRGPRFHRA